jgi:hypothetical protein
MLSLYQDSGQLGSDKNWFAEKPLQNLACHWSALSLYHRERIWFSSTLSCIKEKEEITKTPRGLSPCLPKAKGRALFLKGARSTNYLHLSTSPHFNQAFPLHPT